MTFKVHHEVSLELMLKKRNSYPDEIAQVPQLKLNGRSLMWMQAHDLDKQEIDFIVNQMIVGSRTVSNK